MTRSLCLALALAGCTSADARPSVPITASAGVALTGECQEFLEMVLAARRLIEITDDCDLTRTLEIPSGVTVRGHATLRAGPGMGAVLSLSSVNDVVIQGLTLDGAGVASGVVATDSSRIRVEGVTALGGKLFGFHFQACEDVVLRDARAEYSWLDGVKVSGNGAGLLIAGGVFTDNGVSPELNGNGIDLYPGGSQTRVIGTVTARNDGAGIVLKGGPASPTRVETDVQIIALESRHNAGPGIELTRHPNHPFPHRIRISGVLADNGREGAFVLGHTVLLDVFAVRNQRYGVMVHKDARDITVAGYVGANGAAFGGSAAGVYVDGQRVYVSVTAKRGASDLLLSDAALDTGPQRYGVRRGPNARYVQFGGPSATW